jgi:integron integrase
MNITVSFPNWSNALKNADLPDEDKSRHRIIINWFLGHLKRERCPASVQSARTFIEGLIERRRPEAWQLEQWREGINWFFREAPSRRRVAERPHQRTKGGVREDREETCSGAGESSSAAAHSKADEARDFEDGRRAYAHTIAEMQERVPLDPWYDETSRLMRVRHLAPSTEESYLGWLRRMERFHGEKDGLESFGEDDLKRFLSYIAVEEGVAGSTQKVALNAGVFFLREVRKFKLGDFSDYVEANPKKYYPVVYSRGEIKRLLERLQAKWRLMAQLQYGCGLRISEVCRLRIKDVDLERGKLYLRASKGDKDRCVPLPRSLHEALQEQLVAVRQVHEADRKAGIPGVHMPGALGRKMSRASQRWEWFWLFPMKSLSKDPRGAADAPKRRHHVLPRAYQKELSKAAVLADIAKRSNSHVLRHSYATHLLENGTNIRTLQDFLGHACIETTMIYLHVMEDQKDATVSPLDTL